MKFFEANSFLTILNDSIKLLPKNGKVMAFVAILSMILSSTFLFLFTYSLQSLTINMLTTFQQSFMPVPGANFTPETSSNPAQVSGQLGQDVALLLAVQNTFVLSFSIISFFTTISTILVSVPSYSAKNLSLKELLSRIGTTWTRPLITILYVSGLMIGYSVFVITLVLPLLVYPNQAAFSVAIFLGIVAFLFYLYLFVVWALAIVVSVVEESCYGIDALQKAAVLVKGKRLHGFLLIICSNFVILIILQGYKMIFGIKGFVNPTIYGLFSVSVSTLAKIFLLVTYTVLYFECKKHHGEEIELNGSLEYTKLATDQLGGDMP